MADFWISMTRKFASEIKFEKIAERAFSFWIIKNSDVLRTFVVVIFEMRRRYFVTNLPLMRSAKF